MILLTNAEAKVIVHDMLSRQGGMTAMFAAQSAPQVDAWYAAGLRLCVDERTPIGSMIVQARQRRPAHDGAMA